MKHIVFFNDIFDIENLDPNNINVGHPLSQKILSFPLLKAL